MMMRENNKKLTLYRPATYHIQVPGELDDTWSEWVDCMAITVVREEDELPTTTLTATIDQAALHGLLRRLHSLGLPLISVRCLEAR
jgi:hypothetical protein